MTLANNAKKNLNVDPIVNEQKHPLKGCFLVLDEVLIRENIYLNA